MRAGRRSGTVGPMDATRPRSAWPELDDDVHALLDQLQRSGVRALHDRCVPGSGAVIDHLAVGANGVWVVAEHHVRGLTRVKATRDQRGNTHLTVNGCDRTRWAKDLTDHVRHVRRAMAEAELLHVAVHGALCFVDTDLSFRQRQVPLDDGVVTWPRALKKHLVAPGPIDVELRAHVHAMLERTFPARA